MDPSTSHYAPDYGRCSLNCRRAPCANQTPAAPMQQQGTKLEDQFGARDRPQTNATSGTSGWAALGFTPVSSACSHARISAAGLAAVRASAGG